MRIATWNIGAGINTNDYKGEFFDKTKEANTDDECLVKIAKAIVDNNISEFKNIFNECQDYLLNN